MAVKPKRKSYDDKFRASAVVMLEGAGYPDKEGSLTYVAKHLGVPHPTLSRWYNAQRNPPPNELVQEKRLELIDMVNAELDAIFKTMPSVRGDASYKDLGTVAGILADKKQLLEGKATERKEITGKDGGAIQSNITVYSDLSDDDLDHIINGTSPFSEGREGKTEYTQ